MFTLPERRGKGIATKVLAELEKWVAELSYKGCVLETGKRQHEAIAFVHVAAINWADSSRSFGEYVILKHRKFGWVILERCKIWSSS